MSNFEMVRGGKIITNPPEENLAALDDKSGKPKQAHNQSNIDNQEKSCNVLMRNWEECVYRNGPIEYSEKTCCHGSEQKIGYICDLIGITSLTPVQCSICNRAKLKEEVSQ